MRMKIDFESSSHIYRVDGVVRPHVTRILKDLGLTPPYPEDRGWLGFGQAAHRCCELLVLGRLDQYGSNGDRHYPGTDEVLWPYIAGFHQKIEELEIRPIAVEQLVYHPTEGYCGKLDLLCTMNGKADECIVDLKRCTGNPPNSTALQTAAYDLAYPGPQSGKRRRFALKLDPFRARLIEYNDSGCDSQAWIGAVRLWKWLNRKR